MLLTQPIDVEKGASSPWTAIHGGGCVASGRVGGGGDVRDGASSPSEFLASPDRGQCEYITFEEGQIVVNGHPLNLHLFAFLRRVIWEYVEGMVCQKNSRLVQLMGAETGVAREKILEPAMVVLRSVLVPREAETIGEQIVQNQIIPLRYAAAVALVQKYLPLVDNLSGKEAAFVSEDLEYTQTYVWGGVVLR